MAGLSPPPLAPAVYTRMARPGRRAPARPSESSSGHTAHDHEGGGGAHAASKQRRRKRGVRVLASELAGGGPRSLSRSRPRLVEVVLAGPPRSAGNDLRGVLAMVLSSDFATIAIEPGCRRRTGLVRVGPGPSRPGPVPGLVGPGRGPAAISAPGLSKSGPGLVGPSRGPAAMGSPGLSGSGPGLVCPGLVSPVRSWA